jgi:hypothetical protein
MHVINSEINFRAYFAHHLVCLFLRVVLSTTHFSRFSALFHHSDICKAELF